MRYAVLRRLRFIDFLLATYGYIRRSMLMDYYGISMPQASRDIKEYKGLAPNNIEYSKTDKVYKKTKAFKRLFG